MPLRSATNSGSTTASTRRPSLTSFPSSRPPDIPPIRSTGAFHRRQKSSASRSSHSQGSSLGAHNHRSNGMSLRASKPRTQPARVKSQYPADSNEKHVEYILVASFDIDRGSVMEHQYPGPVGGDEVMLAELMLPDQTHTRQQDWTIFFLHKDAEAEGESRKQRRLRKRRRKDGEHGEASEGDTEDDEDSEYDEFDDFAPVDLDGPPLVYVLNLVNTKQDNTVKRGAIVKAMAICTRHSFLHIYKPLLLLALEQYFAHPTIDTLATLYESVNNMDLSLMPRLNPYESFILQASSAKDLFIEKFEAMIAQRLAKSSGDSNNTSPTLQNTRTRYGLPRDTHEFDTVVNYANVPVPVKIPTALAVETVGDFSLIKLITIFSTPHSTSPVAFTPTHPHLTTSGPTTHPIIVLLNALLTQKRIIFLGHTLPSSEVAEAVLAACALASGGMLRGFTRYAFPYTDLTKIDDLLKVPGFIAGVTNPAFAHKNEWWDLLCDINTGRMKISTRIEAAPPTEGVTLFQQQNPGLNLSGTANHGTDTTGDLAFMNSVLASINDRHGENAVRIKFRHWISKFTRLAAAFEDVVYGASALHIQDTVTATPSAPFVASFDSAPGSMPPTPGSVKKDGELPAEVLGHGYVWPTQIQKNAELASHATRIEGWRTTRSYYNFVQDLASYYSMRAVKAVDLQHLHDKLAKLRLSPDVSRNIYLAICGTVQTEPEINQLLAMIANGIWDAKIGPQGTGSGLFYIAYGLFHPKIEVREAVAQLLGRIKNHEAGRHFWASLGKYIKTAWEKVTKDGAAGHDETF
ncbi:hypothetical protein AMS68_002783 [Peltaster fructicola]|uniref:UDENN domain-containing protein n=1 Tax=Peltaster fructicola TaxID=286661 RepID=A0A6H0XRF0_9PEZI|nr:hypothetical protein AMS68_002783 [Peltaster fructicola]